MKTIIFLLLALQGFSQNPFLNLKPSPNPTDCGCLALDVQKITVGKDGKETVKDGTATIYQDAIVTSVGAEVHQLTLDTYPYYYDEKNNLLKLYHKDKKILFTIGKNYYLINLN